jgi:hypothetical protein
MLDRHMPICVVDIAGAVVAGAVLVVTAMMVVATMIPSAVVIIVVDDDFLVLLSMVVAVLALVAFAAVVIAATATILHIANALLVVIVVIITVVHVARCSHRSESRGHRGRCSVALIGSSAPLGRDDIPVVSARVDLLGPAVVGVCVAVSAARASLSAGVGMLLLPLLHRISMTTARWLIAARLLPVTIPTMAAVMAARPVVLYIGIRDGDAHGIIGASRHCLVQSRPLQRLCWRQRL